MNNVIILGTLTRDIELKYTQSGSCIGSFGIATNEKWKDQAGQTQEKAHFFDVTAFGKQAETINTYFHKGSRILIEGSLDFQSWTSQSGEKRSKVGIKLKGFTFVDRKNDNPQQGNQPHAHQPSQPTPQHTPTQNQQAAIPDIDINEDEIPFGHIGRSEGGYYAHLI